MDMGNFGFPKMFDFLNHNADYSDESDSDTPYYYPENSDSEASSTCYEDSDVLSKGNGNETVDSNVSVPMKKYHSCYEITYEEISEIEATLDLYEYISIIFLLVDDTSFALQVVRSLVAAGSDNFSRGTLYDWALTSKKWKYKLFEALAIIQNNESLMKFGFCKEDINVMRDAPIYINEFKKVLYSCVCEILKREQAKDLIARVRRDGKFEEDITLHCDPRYMEFHMLFWICQGYISIDKEPYLGNLIKHIEFANWFDVYKNINKEITTLTNNMAKKSDRSKMEDEEEEDCYKIKKPNNPGLVVVINNANFTMNVDRRKEFQNLIPREPLQNRVGSEKDVENLKKTFRGINYTVVVINDVSHDKIVDCVYNTVRSEFQVDQHSVLVLCVLSHGEKGVVFGANSVPIRNKEIINSVSGSSRLVHLLSGIPKVIIIQACQGKGVLYVTPENELLEPDGAETDIVVTDRDNLQLDGSATFDPKDKVVCMATIKGFVSIRSRANGTKYIQQLCRCIDKYHSKKHFMDIMTKVHKNLMSDKCIVKDVNETNPICMIPEIISNLRKSLYLTPKQLTSVKN